MGTVIERLKRVQEMQHGAASSTKATAEVVQGVTADTNPEEVVASSCCTAGVSVETDRERVTFEDHRMVRMVTRPAHPYDTRETPWSRPPLVHQGVFSYP
jgi:hypothetical protein